MRDSGFKNLSDFEYTEWMDEAEWDKRLRAALLSAWRNKDKITIPFRDIDECNILSFEAGLLSRGVVLELKVPLLVDDDGFQVKIEPDERLTKEDLRALIRACEQLTSEVYDRELEYNPQKRAKLCELIEKMERIVKCE